MSKTDSLYVSNLPYNTNDEDLAAAFDGCLKAKVIMDPNTQRSRGFGFVQFESAEAADAMIEKTNGEVEIDGRTCKVNHANPPRSDGERRGGGGGGFGGGGRGFGGRGRGGSGGGGGGGRYSGNYSRDGGSSYGGRESSSGGYGGYKRNTGGSSGGSYTSTGYGYSSSGH